MRFFVLLICVSALAAGAQPIANPCMTSQRQLTIESAERSIATLKARDSAAVVVLGVMDDVLRPQFDEVLQMTRWLGRDTVILNAHLVSYECTAEEEVKSVAMVVSVDAAWLRTKRGWSDTLRLGKAPFSSAEIPEVKGFPYEIVIYSVAVVALATLFFFVRSH